MNFVAISAAYKENIMMIAALMVMLLDERLVCDARDIFFFALS